MYIKWSTWDINIKEWISKNEDSPLPVNIRGTIYKFGTEIPFKIQSSKLWHYFHCKGNPNLLKERASSTIRRSSGRGGIPVNEFKRDFPRPVLHRSLETTRWTDREERNRFTDANDEFASANENSAPTRKIALSFVRDLFTTLHRLKQPLATETKTCPVLS